ncbi:MAG: hypothetical protein IKU83_04895 [Lachnospiraceae bacterium]|nr:hypothetical protein [Lachnospiraceae bacterium]
MNHKDNYNIGDFDYLANSASSMDCTGLIPASPVEEANLYSYNEVRRYLPPRVEIKDEPPAKIH